MIIWKQHWNRRFNSLCPTAFFRGCSLYFQISIAIQKCFSNKNVNYPSLANKAIWFTIFICKWFNFMLDTVKTWKTFIQTVYLRLMWIISLYINFFIRMQPLAHIISGYKFFFAYQLLIMLFIVEHSYKSFLSLKILHSNCLHLVIVENYEKTSDYSIETNSYFSAEASLHGGITFFISICLFYS